MIVTPHFLKIKQYLTFVYFGLGEQDWNDELSYCIGWKGNI